MFVKVPIIVLIVSLCISISLAVEHGEVHKGHVYTAAPKDFDGSVIPFPPSPP